MCQLSRHSFGHGGRLSEGGACRAVAPSEGGACRAVAPSEGGACRAVAPSEGGSEPNRRQPGPSEAIKKSKFFQFRAFAAVQSLKFNSYTQAIRSKHDQV